MTMVRRAYLVDSITRHAERVIVRTDISYIEQDNHKVGYYFIFIPGNAWVSRRVDSDYQHLVFLPGEIEFHDWWNGWWEQNWKLPDWVWCYGIGYKEPWSFSRRDRSVEMELAHEKRARKLKWRRQNGSRRS